MPKHLKSKKIKYKKTKRNTKKSRKSKKLRGGNRIGGNNIGANCGDPNFSIYNTNLLKLFPYKGGSAIPPERNMELLQSPEAQERERLIEEERQRSIEEDERQRLDNIRQQNEEDEIRRANIQNDVIYPRAIPRIQDQFINNIPDDDEPGMEPLRLSDLGGSKQKNKRKVKKGKKSKKGGKLQLNDPYKNLEGPQY